MKIRVQLVVCDDDGHVETFTDVAVLEKACQRIEHLGLTLPEAKQILAALQQRLIEQQTSAFVATRSQCEHCGKSLGIKGYHTRTFRTLFGTVPLTSPRLYHCRCQRRKTTTFRPLNALLTDAVAPELLFMETKWASLVSYGLTAQALKDFLPVDATLNATTVRHHALAVAQRYEDKLGEEQWAFVEGCPADWATLPIPDGPLTVGIDGWYLWHGNVYKALQVVQSVEMDLDAAVATSGHGTTRKLLKAIEEFHTYIDNNAGFIPNYGERYRYGERISTGFVESTVNQVINKRFCKRQQMQWTKRGTHLLLQTRVKTLNGELGAVFKRWYPDLQLEEEPWAA